uniref:Uncharacterized protein n=1 Tax=Esox lucius TaxID=8010 RepID=A0AAY5KEH7_ESOLU
VYVFFPQPMFLDNKIKPLSKIIAAFLKLMDIIYLNESEPLYNFLSKKYGSVFTVSFGPRKVVVLAGYRTVKEALVNHAEEFGERGIFPLPRDLNQGHGKAFDTTQPIHYAISNVICSIVYGSRFEYSDPRFRRSVERVWYRIGSKSVVAKNDYDIKRDIQDLVTELKETLNPQMCRCFIDSFLVRKQTLEVFKL